METDFLDLYAPSDDGTGHPIGLRELERHPEQSPIEGCLPSASRWPPYPYRRGHRVAGIKMARVGVSGLAHPLGDGWAASWEVVGDYAGAGRQVVEGGGGGALWALIRLRPVLPARVNSSKRGWLFGKVYEQRHGHSRGGGRTLPWVRTRIVVYADGKAEDVGKEVYPIVGVNSSLAAPEVAG